MQPRSIVDLMRPSSGVKLNDQGKLLPNWKIGTMQTPWSTAIDVRQEAVGNGRIGMHKVARMRARARVRGQFVR